jgi:hypothetical protein
MATSQENVKLIHRYRQALGRAQIVANAAVRRQQALEKRFRAELELWFDDLKAEGIDPCSEVGRMMTVQRFFSEPEPPREEVW